MRGVLPKHSAVHLDASGGFLVASPCRGPVAGGFFLADLANFFSHSKTYFLAIEKLFLDVLESMKAAHYGRIINIISTSVKVPLKGLGVSNTIRGAVASWAKTMSIEVAPFGITVNNVLPGFTDSLDLPQKFADMSVFKRLATSKEQAKAATFLLTQDSSYITGQSIRSDGGVTRHM